MLYKPNFCAECGEKIDRSSWSWLASRRFCDACARIFENPNRIKKAVAAAAIFIGGILAGQIGLTTKQAVVVTSARTQALAANTQSTVSTTNTQNQSLAASSVSQNINASSPPPNITKTNANLSSLSAASSVQTQEEAKSYCGARTQKGTPCTHRVSSGQRCWQHAGKPAILPPNKLLIR